METNDSTFSASERETLQEEIKKIQLALKGNYDAGSDEDDSDGEVLNIDTDRPGENDEEENVDRTFSSKTEGTRRVVDSGQGENLQIIPEEGATFDPDESLPRLTGTDGEEFPSNLVTCLALNQAYQEMITDSLKRIELQLVSNRERQNELQSQLKERVSSSDAHRRKPHRLFSVPFFKDINGMAPPQNEDFRLKLVRGVVIQHEKRPSIWTAHEKKQLTKAVKEDAMKKLLQPFMNRKELEVDKLMSTKDDQTKEEIHRKIAAIEKEIECKWTISESDMFDEVKVSRLDWMKISNIDLCGRRDPQSCRQMWVNVMSASINRDRWTKAENEKLRELADKHQRKNWQTVAQELGTSRTAFQCHQHYELKLAPQPTTSWLAEEDAMLMEVVTTCRMGNRIPWTQVSFYMEDKSPSQCQVRFNQLDPAVKRGKWEGHEDAALIMAVNEFGPRNWGRCAEYVHARNAAQCRERWINALDPAIKFGDWTYEEDMKILELLQTETSWTAVAKELNGRTDSQVMRRYKVLMKWKEQMSWLDQQPADSKAFILRNAPRESPTNIDASVNKAIEGEPSDHGNPPAIEITPLGSYKPTEEESIMLRELLSRSTLLAQHAKDQTDVDTAGVSGATVKIVSRPPGMSSATKRYVDRMEQRERIRRMVQEKVQKALALIDPDSSLPSNQASRLTEEERDTLIQNVKSAMTVRDMLDLSRGVKKLGQGNKGKGRKKGTTRYKMSQKLDRKLIQVVQSQQSGSHCWKRVGRKRRYFPQDRSQKLSSSQVHKVGSNTLAVLIKALNVDPHAIWDKSKSGDIVPKTTDLAAGSNQEKPREKSDSEVEYDLNSLERLVEIGVIKTDLPPGENERGFLLRKGNPTELPPLPPSVTNILGFRALLLHRQNLLHTAGSYHRPDFYDNSKLRSSSHRNRKRLTGRDKKRKTDLSSQKRLKTCNGNSQADSTKKTASGEDSHDASVGVDLGGEDLDDELGESEPESEDPLANYRDKPEFRALKSRFNALFVWPSLLSVIPPVSKNARKKTSIATYEKYKQGNSSTKGDNATKGNDSANSSEQAGVTVSNNSTEQAGATVSTNSTEQAGATASTSSTEQAGATVSTKSTEQVEGTVNNTKLHKRNHKSKRKYPLANSSRVFVKAARKRVLNRAAQMKEKEAVAMETDDVAVVGAENGSAVAQEAAGRTEEAINDAAMTNAENSKRRKRKGRPKGSKNIATQMTESGKGQVNQRPSARLASKPVIDYREILPLPKRVDISLMGESDGTPGDSPDSLPVRKRCNRSWFKSRECLAANTQPPTMNDVASDGSLVVKGPATRAAPENLMVVTLMPASQQPAIRESTTILAMVEPTASTSSTSAPTSLTPSTLAPTISTPTTFALTTPTSAPNMCAAPEPTAQRNECGDASMDILSDVAGSADMGRTNDCVEVNNDDDKHVMRENYGQDQT